MAFSRIDQVFGVETEGRRFINGNKPFVAFELSAGVAMLKRVANGNMKSSRILTRFAIQLESVNQAHRTYGRQIPQSKTDGCSEAIRYVAGLILTYVS